MFVLVVVVSSDDYCPHGDDNFDDFVVETARQCKRKEKKSYTRLLYTVEQTMVVDGVSFFLQGMCVGFGEERGAVVSNGQQEEK